MKKSCALTFLVWAALVALYARLAWPKVHEVAPTAIIAVLGGTFAGMLVAGTIGLFTGAGDAAAFARAARGEPRRNGRIEAASGPVRPLGAPLEAPFSGKACVAYEYDVKNPGAQRSDFAGMALTPCVVDAPNGQARILAWAMLDSFPATGAEAVDAARAEAYLRGAPAEPLGLANALTQVSSLLTDDDGSIRKDFRIADAPGDLGGRSLVEKTIPIGATVTAVGRWSEARSGFAPEGGLANLRLFPGGLEENRDRVKGSPVRTFFTAVFFFCALHAILVPMWFLAPKRDASGRQIPKNASVWDERDCDRLRELLAAGANPNERNQGRTALMNAAREGSVPCVERLIAAGARLEDVDDQGNTALAEAVMAGREDTTAALLAAGAQDFRVTEGPGRFQLTVDSEPFSVVREYLAAVHEGDFETMAKLVPGTTKAKMEERREDLDLWRSLRPKTPDLVNGWTTDDSATLTVRGLSTSGERVVCYHLQKTLEGWRIFREWFPVEPRR